MSFYISFGYLEYILVALFLAIYGLYFLLARYKAQRLYVPLRGYFWIKFFFRGLYLSFLIVAMLGPVLGSEKQQIKVQSKDIIFTIDVSGSMEAQDVLPTRLEKVKYELQNLLFNRLQARVGVVVFASEAYRLCPLTKDYSLLQNIFIPTLSVRQMQGQSTQIKNALKMSIESVLREAEDKIHKRAKIIVLFTDGEDFGEDYTEEAKLIQRKGINLLIVGVGSVQGSHILTPTGFKKDKNGEKVITKLNRDALMQLAVTSGGKYFEISQNQDFSRNDMDKVRANLEEIQGKLEDKREISLEANKYIYPLTLAFLMICLDVSITTRIIKIK